MGNNCRNPIIMGNLRRLIKFRPLRTKSPYGMPAKNVPKADLRNGNKMFKKSLYLFVIISLFSACSSLKKKPASKPSEMTQSEKLNVQADAKKNLELAEFKMDQLVLEAKKAGPNAVKYLSSDLYIKATDSSMRGDSNTASFLYKYVMKLSPNDTYLMKKYSIELIRNGRLAESKSLLRTIWKKESYEEGVGLILAGVLTALEEKKEARKVYQKLLVKHPKSEEACVFLAKSYRIEKKYKSAFSTLNKCEKRNPGKAIYSYSKGKLMFFQNKDSKAKTYFSKAIKIDPSFHKAVVALGVLHEEKEQYKKAISIYKKFLKKNPYNYAVLSRVVQVMFASQSYDNIITYAERLSSLDTSDMNLKVRLGILYTDAKRFDDAKGVFKEILAEVPSSDKVLYYLGSLYQQTQHSEDAIGYFQKIPTSSSLFHDSNIQIAQILHVLAKQDLKLNKKENISRFTSFIEDTASKHKGLKVELKIILTTFYENINNFPRAIEHLSSIKDYQGYTEGHDYYLASLYEKNNEFDAAKNLIENILKKNPDNAHALNFLGYSLLEKGEDMDKAYELISKAVSIQPNDGYIRDSLGWYYYKVGQFKKALREIKKARALVKTDVVISKHLAIVYQSLQKYDKAKAFYVEALKNCKLDSEKAEVMKALENLESARLPASKKK